MKVKSESEVTQSCPTLRDPMDCSLPGSSVQGVFQAPVPEWGAIAFSENAVLGRDKHKERALTPATHWQGHHRASLLLAFYDQVTKKL